MLESERLRGAIERFLETAKSCRQQERGSGGMTIEAQISRTVINGLPLKAIFDLEDALNEEDTEEKKISLKDSLTHNALSVIHHSFFDHKLLFERDAAERDNGPKRFRSTLASGETVTLVVYDDPIKPAEIMIFDAKSRNRIFECRVEADVWIVSMNGTGIFMVGNMEEVLPKHPKLAQYFLQLYQAARTAKGNSFSYYVLKS